MAKRQELTFLPGAYRQYSRLIQRSPNSPHLYADVKPVETDQLRRLIVRDVRHRRTDQVRDSFVEMIDSYFYHKPSTNSPGSVDLMKIISDPITVRWTSHVPRFGDDNRRLLDRMHRLMDESVTRVMRRMNVGVIGAGKTGSQVIWELSRLPLQSITVIDHDFAEMENLAYLTYPLTKQEADDISKVAAVQKHVQPTFSFTDLNAVFADATNPDTLFEELRDADVLICCADQALVRVVLNLFAVQYAIPLIDSGITVNYDEDDGYQLTAQLQKTIPNQYCLECNGGLGGKDQAAEQAMSPYQRELARRAGELPEEAPTASLGPLSHLMGTQVTLEFLNLLTGFRPFHRRWDINLQNQTEMVPDLQLEELTNENCIVCGPHTGRTGYGDELTLPSTNYVGEKFPTLKGDESQ